MSTDCVNQVCVRYGNEAAKTACSAGALTIATLSVLQVVPTSM